MVDDTSQQPLQDNTQVSDVPVSPSTDETPSDQNTSAPSSTDIGQIPPKWPSEPETTPSARVDLSETDSQISPLPVEAEAKEGILANDQTATPYTQPAEIKDEKPETPVIPEQPKEETQPQVTSPENSQSEEAKSDWPISPILANEVPEKTQVVKTETPIQSPEIPVESKQPEVSAQPQISSVEPKPEETKPENLANQSQEGTQVSETPVDKQPEPLPPQQANIDVQPPDNQVTQVQSGPSESTSNNDSEKTENPMASLVSKPLESPQIAPNQPSDNSTPGKSVSFGDILENKTSSDPKPTQEPSKFFSFGDLLNEAQNTDKSNIPDDLFEIKDTPQETVLPTPSQPIQQQSTPSVTTQTPQPVSIPSTPPEPKIIEKIVEKQVEVIKEVIKEVPFINQDEVDKQLKDKLKTEQDQRRFLANQARSQKKSNHLEKVLELARNTENISNEDIQRLLHVSQSTATNYLSELTRNGMLKREGIRGGAKYSI